MFKEELIKRLFLSDSGSKRSFCVCLSGGVDSSLLLHLMTQLRSQFQFELQALHLNYGLRGSESNGDEKFVRNLCRKLSVALNVRNFKLKRGSAVQESARKARLKAISELPSSVEILEAHHQDDQIETFFLNLFRGAGIRGLASLKVKSEREGRIIWRPLLAFSKQEIRNFARKSKMKFREDSSNQKDLYDRNFIRQKLLPLIESRFPAARKSLLSSIGLFQDLDQRFQDAFRASLGNSALVLSLSPLELNLALLKEWPHYDRMSFFYQLLSGEYKLQISRQHLSELSKACLRPAPWAINLPKNIIVRAKARKRLVFQGLNRVLGSDKMTSDIILRVIHEHRS